MSYCDYLQHNPYFLNVFSVNFVKSFTKTVQFQVNAGLGNQLFQACAALSYGLNFDRDIILDGSWYSIQKYRPKRFYLLDKLLPLGTISCSSYATRLLSLRSRSFAGIFSLLLQKSTFTRQFFSNVHNMRFIFENTIHDRSDDLLSDYPENRVIMVGSWQTAEHFERAGNLLRLLIRPRFETSSDYFVFSKAISSSVFPVSVHVRRGDFLSLGHGVHTTNYYRAAADAIRGRLLAEPDWFVFSEDQDWCRSNLDFLGDRVRFVNVKSAHAEIEELLLMRECRAGAIIANSSFSWWGAALGDEPCRPVIASRYRHGIGEGDVQAQRLLPHWQMVEEF